MSDQYESRYDKQPQLKPCAGTKHHQKCGLDCKWVSEKKIQANCEVNKEVGKEISAMEFISWIKGISAQDCRPKLYDNVSKSYMLYVVSNAHKVYLERHFLKMLYKNTWSLRNPARKTWG